MIVLVGLDETELVDSKNIVAIKRTNNQQELAQIYSAADVFVNPTMEDNFPTVNLESLACGTPIITYNTGGSPECIDDNTGVVIEKGNYEALKEAVFEVIEKGKCYYNQNCILKSKQYDMNDCFNQYVDLYEEIVR